MKAVFLRLQYRPFTGTKFIRAVCPGYSTSREYGITASSLRRFVGLANDYKDSTFQYVDNCGRLGLEIHRE